MSYSLVYSKKADKQLDKLNKSQKRIILAWLRKNLHGTKTPRQYGKALSGNHEDKWSYRIGKYRALVEKQDNELLVVALEIGRRKEGYE